MRTTAQTIAVFIAAGLVLSGCAESSDSVAVETSAVHEPPLSYVALGDSYASMASQGDMDPTVPFCMRSADNYPAQLAKLLGTTVTDVSCQGAITDDLVAPNQFEETIPAQLDSVDETTTLITLTIGGNDIGFGDIAACANDPEHCSDQLVIDTKTELDNLGAKLDATYDAIHAKAPNAHIITTGYLPLITHGDDCSFLHDIDPQTREWFVHASEEINASVSAAAARHGATYILPTHAENHTACAAADERWTDFDGTETNAFPMHPTAAGQTAMALAAFESLNRNPQ